MKRFLHLIPVFAFFLGGTAISLWVGSEQANAQGCCFGSQRPPAYPVGPPVPINPTAPAGTAMNSYYGSYGTLPPSPGTLLPAGLPQSTAAFFPTAAYDTRWMQTPVTYYRPVTQFDPNYGTTVTSLQPCTSYQYQAARVPLVSPRTIGDYSYSANRRPIAATPGYYPNNVVPAGTVPVGAVPGGVTYPTMQQLPAVGTPVTSGMMGYSSTGTSSGPASTLPLATMPSPVGGVVTANHMAPMGSVPMGSVPFGTNQYAATPATAWMPATAAPISQVPITSAIPGTGTPIYTVPATAPTSSLVPANTMSPCPNGVCAPGSIPSFPGATSVVPLGPPTVMAPSNGSPVMSNAPSVANPVLPNTGVIQPIMPPTSNSDPEATRQPSLGSSASTFPLKRVPVAEFDRPATSMQEESRARVSIPSNISPNGLSPSNTLQPLKAPSDLDAKPRWNPKLLPPSKGDSGETVASTSTSFCVTV